MEEGWFFVVEFVFLRYIQKDFAFPGGVKAY
jgi:hypothetical protein